jgi:hypothetical protein
VSRPPRSSSLYRLRVALVGVLGALLLRLLGCTWRVGRVGNDPFLRGDRFVAALWHRGFPIALHLWRDRGIAVPVSRSRDGDLVAGVLRRMGYAESPRGSSSRGATSLLRELIRRVRGGEVVGMLVDGPRGPARAAKPGAVALARATGAELVPVGLSATRCVRFGSWDRALLPLPFARVWCVYGTPLPVPKKEGDRDVEVVRRELESALDAVTDEADRRAGREPDPLRPMGAPPRRAGATEPLNGEPIR